MLVIRWHGNYFGKKKFRLEIRPFEKDLLLEVKNEIGDLKNELTTRRFLQRGKCYKNAYKNLQGIQSRNK